MILCVDFDGTIVEHKYPRIGQPVPGALEWLIKYQDLGVQLILWTMRSDGPDGKTLTEAVEYCRQRGLKFWGVNTNPSQSKWTTSPKAYAHLYIDDAAFGCPLIPGRFGERKMVDWEIAGPLVEKMIYNNVI